MLIDEAIQHCKEVACNSKTCNQCSQDHIQLSIWLQGLSDIIDVVDSKSSLDDIANEVINILYKYNIMSDKDV
ncbi:hypothetical protein D3C73_1614630 [compost metagenome]